MNEKIVQTYENVAIFGGGALYEGDVALAKTYCSSFIACDGGANLLFRAGHVPDWIIGDMDSVDARVKAQVPSERFVHILEQDTTDFEKALSRVSAPLILGFGFTGKRIDHELAVYSALSRYPDKSCIIVGAEDICLHVPEGFEMALPIGTRVSLFPMASVTGRSSGLKWPIDGIEFAPNGQIGTSNITTETILRLSFEQAGMLLILPREFLGDLIAALRSPDQTAD